MPTITTRSDRLCAVIRARGGRCDLTTLTGDLERKGFPRSEIFPALTIAVLAHKVRQVDEHTVEVTA